MTSVQDIRSAILAGNFTNADLDTIGQCIQFARAQLATRNKCALRRGDVVKFTSNRDGRTYQGTIEKIAIKYINVRTPVGVYRVPANMLEAV
jgi:hypothetical protein